MYVCVNGYMYVCVCALYVRVCIYEYVYGFGFMYVCVCMCVYILDVNTRDMYTSTENTGIHNRNIEYNILKLYN